MLEIALIVINFAVLIGALIYNSRKDESLRSEYERWVEARVAVYEKKISEYEKKIDNLEKSVRIVVTDTLRLTGENIWLRNILELNQITVPPEPEQLLPHVDAAGNITISIDSTGTRISGKTIGVHGDVVGRDKREG